MKTALRDVVVQISAKSEQLNQLDDDISKRLLEIQESLKRLRPTGKPVDVAFPPWGKLGWSGRRGRWRFVVVDDEECEDLMNMPRSCRAGALLVLDQLIDRMELPK